MLWGMRPRKARALLNFFYNRALLLAGAKQQNKPGYRLHDIVRYLGKRLIQSPVEPKVLGVGPWGQSLWFCTLLQTKQLAVLQKRFYCS